MNLRTEIEIGVLNNASLSDLKSILIRFKENGGTKEQAHLTLYELLQEASSEKEDANLRDLIDFTIGYSGKIPTIWN